MRKKSLMLIMLVLMLLCNSSCAKSNENIASAIEDSEGTVASTVTAEQTFRVKQFLPLTLDETDREFSEKQFITASYGSKLYLLASYRSEDSIQPSLWLYTFDMNTLGLEKSPFSLPLQEDERFYIASMYITGANEITLLLYGTFEGILGSPALCKTDLTGKPINGDNPFSDSTETFDNLALTGNKFFAIPDSLSIITEWEDATHTTQLYSYDTQTDQRQSLTTLSNDFISSLCSNGKDTLYYIGNGELKKLDTQKQSCEVLCNIRDCGITSYGNECLLINDKEELAFCVVEGEKPGIYLLTDEEETLTDSDIIRLVRLQFYGMEYASKLAASWSVESDSAHIKVEKTDNEQKQEALHNRTMMEIVAGNGPELMWVSEEDMRILAEKGALMDMSELIPSEIKEQLLPGVLKVGTIDGTLVGITPEVSFYTVFTPDSVWSRDSWSISDVMSLVESRDDWEWPLSYSIYKPDFYTLFYFLLKDLADSPFVDMENGVSHFDSDEFIQVLEFCKKYGEKDSVKVDWDDLDEMMQNGTCAAQVSYFYDGFGNFSHSMPSLKDCHIVGFPRNEGSGNYLYSEAYLVVSANATHIDAIKDFIAYLLDYDNQYTVSFSPVRKDVLRDSVVITPHSNTPAILKSTSYEVYRPIETKPDGTSYLEEFMTFAESCEPQPLRPEAISDILGDELPSFVADDKNAKEVADIIHRRVQLYFAEQK